MARTLARITSINDKQPEWVRIDFSILGFIGKVFPSQILGEVVDYYTENYVEAPIDWLLLSVCQWWAMTNTVHAPRRCMYIRRSVRSQGRDDMCGSGTLENIAKSRQHTHTIYCVSPYSLWEVLSGFHRQEISREMPHSRTSAHRRPSASGVLLQRVAVPGTSGSTKIDSCPLHTCFFVLAKLTKVLLPLTSLAPLHATAVDHLPYSSSVVWCSSEQPSE